MNYKKIEKCIFAKLCGGCTLQGFSYEKQLRIKQEKIEKLMGGLGPVKPIIGMEDPTHYRNKVQVSFGYDDNHHVICGNYVPSTHLIVPVDDCMITDERANEIINSLRKLVIKHHISIFNERSYKGCLRHVLIRSSKANEYMVVLVTGSSYINNRELLIKDIIKYNPDVVTIVQNINNAHTSMVLGQKNLVLYGKGRITDELCGLSFDVSPNSFFQVNKRQTEILYKTAIDLASFNGNESVIDAYCGTGTIGMIFSKNVKKVIGVEINRFAIKDAINNAKRNKIGNISFVCDDAGKYMTALANKKAEIDVLIMDPPRSGADIPFLKSTLRLKPKKIVYISCGPESLRNNLLYLKKYGYQVKAIQPVDMFPFTDHVETVVLMSRVNTPD